MRPLRSFTSALVLACAGLAAQPAFAAQIMDLNYDDDETSFVWNFMVDLGVVGIDNAYDNTDEWANTMRFRHLTGTFDLTSQHLEAPHATDVEPNPAIYSYAGDPANLPLTGGLVFLDQSTKAHPAGHRDRWILRYEKLNQNQVQFSLIGLHQARAVPEPTTWAMMLLGFSVIGARLRKAGSRRTRATITV